MERRLINASQLYKAGESSSLNINWGFLKRKRIQPDIYLKCYIKIYQAKLGLLHDYFLIIISYFSYRAFGCWHRTTPPPGAFSVRPLPSNNHHHHEAGHEKCERPQCQTHRWMCTAKTSQDPAGERQAEGRTLGRGSCGCFSGSVLAGCCEEWERSNQQVYCRRNSSQ